MTKTTFQDKTCRLHFGIDVSKAHLDIHCLERNESWRIANAAADIRAFISENFGAPGEALVVVDGAGGLEYLCCELLAAAGVRVHRANTRRIRNYIRSLGENAKTDRLDARHLAAFGRERGADLRLFAAESPARRQLRLLAARREQLIRMRTAEKNRLSGPGGAALKRSHGVLLRTLEREITRIETEIRALVSREEALRRRRAVLMAIPGIGENTAHALLALIPELGALDRRQAAALAGLAPYARDSGAQRGYRSTAGGRSGARRALFMAALSAIRFNGHIRAFYERLLENGKKPIVALTAAARKLLTIANAKLRDENLPQLS